MRWLYLSFLFIALGLVGAFPALLLAYFFTAAQGAIAWQIYLIGAILLGSWLPLKGLIDSRVKGQPLSLVFPKHINSLALSFALVAFLFFIPVLYFSTALTFLLAILIYNISNFPIALLSALLIQSIMLYRSAVQEKEFGTNNMVFMRFNEMSFGDDVILNAERQTPRSYAPEILILPAEIEEEESFDDDSDNIIQSNSSES